MAKRNTTCCHCGSAVTTTQAKGPIECRACRHAMKRSGIRVCILCGAEFNWTNSAKCSPCKHGPNRDNEPTYTKDCKFCAKSITVQDNRTIYCSKACAQKSRHGYSQAKEVLLWKSPERAARSWIGHTLPSTFTPGYVNGPCQYCRKDFTARLGTKYCSQSCGNNASWQRKIERWGEFYISPAARLEIYIRDGWQCQLCGDSVDPNLDVNHRMSATLDHIIPQSLSPEPDHSPSNLRLAHRSCNSKRGNKMEAFELTA